MQVPLLHPLLWIVVVALVVRLHRRHSQTPFRLLTDRHGNEAIVVRGTIDSNSYFFMVDTAYAGAPVLSTSYLMLPRPPPLLSLEAQYRHVVDRLDGTLSADAHHRAVASLLGRASCRSFTSGCTMRLMGIGTTMETQTDMLLCDAVRLDGQTAVYEADMFVTHPLPSSVHILTMDFLLHRAPCIIMPRRGIICWRALHTAERSFEFHTPQFVGGAPRITMVVGGAHLNIVLDTGAGAALSLSAEAAQRIEACERTSIQKATQTGVNGERVCSDAIATQVRIGQLYLGNIEVFVNTGHVEGADGYAGMGLLRMLDMWLSAYRIGLRLSGLPARVSQALSPGSCNEGKPLMCLPRQT